LHSSEEVFGAFFGCLGEGSWGVEFGGFVGGLSALFGLEGTIEEGGFVRT
jgi:hypothetical protein